MIKCIKHNEIAKVNTKAKKSFVHVEDICKIINIVLKKKMKNSIYNLSVNKPIELINVLKYLSQKFNLKYQSNNNETNYQYLLRCRINKEIKIR